MHKALSMFGSQTVCLFPCSWWQLHALYFRFVPLAIAIRLLKPVAAMQHAAVLLQWCALKGNAHGVCIPCNKWWNKLELLFLQRTPLVDVSNDVQVSPRLIQNDAIGIQIQPEVITVDPTLINIGPNGANPSVGTPVLSPVFSSKLCISL